MLILQSECVLAMCMNGVCSCCDREIWGNCELQSRSNNRRQLSFSLTAATRGTFQNNTKKREQIRNLDLFSPTV